MPKYFRHSQDKQCECVLLFITTVLELLCIAFYVPDSFSVYEELMQVHFYISLFSKSISRKKLKFC